MRNIGKLLRLVSVSYFVLLCVSAPLVSALSDLDLESIYRNSVHYKTNDHSGSTCDVGTGQKGGANSYVIGDSISTGLSGDGIEGKLQTAVGGTSFVNHDSGRSITQPGTEVRTSALNAVDGDRTVISGAGTIVIVLGTNPTDDPFNQNLVSLMTKLKAIAPNAKYYWVDIGATRANTAATWSARNKVIYDNAQSQGYTVISRYKAIFGADKDPLNIQPGLPIPGSSDFVHGAYPQLSSAIIDAVSGKGGGGGCGCTLLAGKDNAEKVWNFLISKGLTPPQAAGIMGNLQAESGFEPRRVQYGGTNSRGETSVAGKPSSLDDTMRIDGSTGYGLAQWTSKGRQQGLHDFAVSRSTKDGDMGTQLEWLYKEATGRGDWAKVQQESDAGQAAFIWHKYYEISADGPEKIQNRMNFARDILLRLGSGGGSGGGAASC